MSTPTCAYEGCDRPVYQSPNFPETDKCIFHCEKKDVTKFRAYVEVAITEWNRASGKYDFHGWMFVGSEWMGQIRTRSEFREMDFTEAHFIDFADFHGMTFGKPVTFKGASFGVSPSFENAKFQKLANFDQTHFPFGANFRYAEFDGRTTFERSEWTGDMDFSYASFDVAAELSDIKIPKVARFIWPGLGLTYEKDGTPFVPGTVIFERMGYDSGDGILDLRNNALRDGAILNFRNSKMHHVLLVCTDCRRIQFDSVEWPLFDGRQVMADELDLREDPKLDEIHATWQQIESAYQQLTVKCRSELHYPSANNFERGFFEARRKNARANGAWRTYALFGLYKALSNYSGSIQRVLFWIVFSSITIMLAYDFLLFGGRFLISDFSRAAIVGLGGYLLLGTSVYIFGKTKHRLSRFASVVSRLAILALIGLYARFCVPPFATYLAHDTFALALRSMSLGSINLEHLLNADVLRGISYTERSWFMVIALLQTALTATLVTLFIFAIRRRFKHSE